MLRLRLIRCKCAVALPAQDHAEAVEERQRQADPFQVRIDMMLEGQVHLSYINMYKLHYMHKINQIKSHAKIYACRHLCGVV